MPTRFTGLTESSGHIDLVRAEAVRAYVIRLALFGNMLPAALHLPWSYRLSHVVIIEYSSIFSQNIPHPVHRIYFLLCRKHPPVQQAKQYLQMSF